MQDAENSYLADGLTEGGAVEELTGSSITYRIAVRPYKGRPVYRLQSLPAQLEEVRTEAGKAVSLCEYRPLQLVGYCW